jgi:ABC-type sugar transport system ATPase subunit
MGQARDTAAADVLEVRGIKMHYGAVEALAGVDMALRRGEVLGLVGDNGAGKSTLIKCIGGVQTPTEGQILLDGGPQGITGPEVARALGIETVHQSLNLIDSMNVAQNFFLNRELVTRRGRLLGWLDRAAMHDETQRSLHAFDVDIGHTRRSVAELSGGQRQMVAVVRAVHWKARVVMMDEATAALGVQQSLRVLQLARQLADAGIAVLFVSHNMDHVMQVCDRVLVLRRGRKVADLTSSQTTINEIVGYITGIDEGAARLTDVAGARDAAS